MKLILIAIALLLSACANSGSGSGATGSSPSPTPQSTPTTAKILSSLWRGEVAPPAQNLGFDTSSGSAVMYVDLSSPTEINILIGPGIDSLECTFQRQLSGTENAGTLVLGTFKDSGQANLAAYCQSLQGTWIYQKDTAVLSLCQSASNCISLN